MALAAPTLQVGDIRIWAVVDGKMARPAPPNFAGLEGDDRLLHGDFLGSDRWLMEIGGFVVQSGDRVVLVDAGVGGDGSVYRPPVPEELADASPILAGQIASLGLKDPDEIASFLARQRRSGIVSGTLGANLSRLGFRPDDITDVALSHLHFDHIGWISRDGRPYFPNAVVRCERHDAEHFLERDHDESYLITEFNAMPTKERFAPVLDRLETWDEDATLAVGIDARFSPGHTPGSSVFAITSGVEQAMILGDTVHCPQELTDPEFNGQYRAHADIDFPEAERVRQHLRDHAVEHDVEVGCPHFEGLRFGRLSLGDRPRSWRFEWTTPPAIGIVPLVDDSGSDAGHQP